MIRRSTLPLTGIILVAMLAGCAGLQTPAIESPQLEWAHYRFDAGGLPTMQADLPLTLADTIDATRTYGWTLAPRSRFMRTDLTETRDEYTIDGVIGPEIGFLARVPEGVWSVTLHVEAGYEDSSTVQLTLNGRPQLLRWHPFEPPAEPRTEVQDIYRVFHGSAEVGNEGLAIVVRGGAEDVRLMGISIMPRVQPKTDLDEGIMRELTSLGAYGDHLHLEQHIKLDGQPVNRLLEQLDARLLASPSDFLAAYWREQLQLLALAERDLRWMGWEWATERTGMGIFGRFHQAVMLLDAILGVDDPDESPLYERALFQRGRLLYWLAMERGGPNEVAGGLRDLVELYRHYPGDTLLTIYNNEQIDSPDSCDTLEFAENAPEWSVGQREALCRLRAEVSWWVNDRQAANGEFGGKIGDDVELFRWWPPIVLSGDTTALLGWKRLADGVWVARKVHKGYAKRPLDVEHASEFIADTAPEMVLYSDDSMYVDRLRYSARYFKDLWTGFSPQGRRYFKSAWFSSTEVDTRPPRDRDLEMNTRALKAVRYLAWKTRDPEVIQTLHEWSSAWAHAAMRTDKGKPAGIIPASIRMVDEAINGDEPTWYRANMFWDYFDWSGGTKMLDQLLFTYTLTGDSTLLEPMFRSLDLIRDFAAGRVESDPNETGSPAWAAQELQTDISFWGVVESWRLGSDETRYDDLLLQKGTPYTRYRLTGEHRYLVEGTDRLLNQIRYNAPIRTTEVLHTDRVRTPGAMHLKAMLTGDGVSEGKSPYYAVSWEDTDDGFTALVADSGPTRIGVELFSHSSESSTPTMRLWSLPAGSYSVKVADKDGLRDQFDVEVATQGERLSFVLPAKELTSITIKAL